MLSILIIDDTSEKVKQIKQLIIEGGVNTEPQIAHDMREAQRVMGNINFDLVILDLNLPNAWGDETSPNNAIALMNLIQEDEDIMTPTAIIGLTAHELINQYREEFEKYSWQLLKYEANLDTWKTPLKNKIKFLVKHKKSIYMEKRKYKYDIAVINALQTPENTQLKRVLGGQWKVVEIEDDRTHTYFSTTIKSKSGREISVISVFMNQMAGVSAATLTTKVIYNFAPRYVFMTGIAAGVDPSEICYGDILVCSEIWDGASGKIRTDKDGFRKFEPDYRPLALDNELKNICTQMQADQNLLNEIEQGYPTNNGKPNTRLRVHIGPMASVPAVTARKEEIDMIKDHARKLIGIEMESYGLFFAVANCINPRPKFCASFKAVSDFADVEKADDYQEYASYTSASFLKHLIEEKLVYDF